jgi:hypothetical protein
MAPKRAPKSPIPQKKRPGLTPRPGMPKVEPPKAPPPTQHKPWSTSVKGGARGR